VCVCVCVCVYAVERRMRLRGILSHPGEDDTYVCEMHMYTHRVSHELQLMPITLQLMPITHL